MVFSQRLPQNGETMTGKAQEIIAYLRAKGDPEIAAHSQRFFKTGRGEYGEGDRFLGIRVPVIRQAVKKFKDTPLTTAAELLRSEFHEIRLFALLLLVRHYSGSDEKRQGEIVQIYLEHIPYINNWDLVDSSADKILGPYLRGREKTLLYKFARSASLWKRRIAIMTTFHFIKNIQFEDALRLSELLLYDKEDLIHKAVGWMLREIGKRDLETEVEFLNTHYREMPRTMLRYAIEHFSPEIRQLYLKGLI